MRLIDADALDSQIYNDIPINHCGSVVRMANMLELVSKQPTVDAVPVKHGRWELVDEAEPRRYGCSERSCLSWYGTYKYCPNCGAKMDGGEADDRA